MLLRRAGLWSVQRTRFARPYGGVGLRLDWGGEVESHPATGNTAL